MTGREGEAGGAASNPGHRMQDVPVLSHCLDTEKPPLWFTAGEAQSKRGYTGWETRVVPPGMA